MLRHGKKTRVMVNGHDENVLIGMIRELEGLMGSPKSAGNVRLIAGLRERIIRTFTFSEYEAFAVELKGMIRQYE